MKTALIALPAAERSIDPPLSLAYLATLLEQRHHIVRIYDLGLEPQINLEQLLQPLRSFRPGLVIVAGDQPDLLASALSALPRDTIAGVLPVSMQRGGQDTLHLCSGVLQWLDQQRNATEWTTQLSLDRLPLPARHLLPLERYNLRAVGGALQTTLIVGAIEHDGRFVLRQPAAIVAELRRVSHEFGLRHYRIPEPALTIDRPWLNEFLAQLIDVQLGIGWEASVQAEALDAELLSQMAQAGCESLCFQLDSSSLFDAFGRLQPRLRQAVTSARRYGIFAHARLKLEPPYEAIPHLVDVAATFGLDAVRFEVVRTRPLDGEPTASQLQRMACQIYDRRRDRQRFEQQFGPLIGALLWYARTLRGPSPCDEMPIEPAIGGESAALQKRR
jgi:hypothetical protein